MIAPRSYQPSRAQRTTIVVFSCLLACAVIATIPFRAVRLGPLPTFLVIYGIVLCTSESATAALLLWRARATQRARFAYLGAAYAFSSPIIVANVLMLPGIGLVTGVVQSAPWFWSLWHIGWPAFVVAFTRVRERPIAKPLRPALVTLAAVIPLVLVMIVETDHLPPLLEPDGTFTGLLHVVYAIASVAGVASIAAVVRRWPDGTALEVLLLPATIATTLDVVVTMLGSARFSVGFYVGRSLGMVAGCVVLFGLIMRIGRIAARAELANASEQRLREFLESVPQIMWTSRTDGSIEWHNRRWQEYTGRAHARTATVGWDDVCHPDDRDALRSLWAEGVVRTTPFETAVRLCDAHARYQWFLVRGAPVVDEHGSVTRWAGSATNIDSERTANLQLDFFATLGDVLGQTLERGAALRALARGLVPRFADWTLVNLDDGTGRLILESGYHHDRAKAQLLDAFIGRPYDLPTPASVSARVFRTGKAAYGEVVRPESIRSGVVAEFGEVIERLGLHSYIAVPIVANGVIYGTFHAIASESDRTYGERDVPFFSEVGRRMGYALQHADMYEREARIAHAFQSAALPAGLPDVPGMAFSYLYEPAHREANIGGDFYDAFRLADGRVVVVIGDVAGAGVAAAATMAALRQSIRATASIDPNPETLLRAAEGALHDAAGPLFASAFVGVIEPLTLTLDYANAGHPAPMVRAPDGTLTLLDASDVLLGLQLDTAPSQRHVGTVRLDAGSFLLLYTDGLSEAKRDPLGGELALMNAMRAVDRECASASDAASRIRDRVIGEGATSHDDMALLTVSFEAPLLAASPLVFQWTFACEDAAEAHRVRGELTSAMRSVAIHDDDIFAAEMILSELVANGVCHARSELQVYLDLTQAAPVLHVLDRGAGFSLNSKLPGDILAEHGRGLYIISQLARSFTVSPRPVPGGSHARVVLPGRVDRSVLLADAEVRMGTAAAPTIALN